MRHPTSQPQAGSAVPNGRDFIAMLEAFRGSGGAAPGSVLSKLLEEYRLKEPVSLAELVYSGQVFGFEWRANLWIPMFQFEADDLGLKLSAQQVRAELPLLSGWALATWFASPNRLLDGQVPANVLASDVEAVMAAARLKGLGNPPPDAVTPEARESLAQVW